VSRNEAVPRWRHGQDFGRPPFGARPSGRPSEWVSAPSEYSIPRPIKNEREGTLLNPDAFSCVTSLFHLKGRFDDPIGD
jgi:hypothetical protein